MICVVIRGPTYHDVRQQISQAVNVADLLELRLDLFESLDLHALRELRATFSIPMIFTLRSSVERGKYTGTEEMRLVEIWRLAELNPEYLDLEYHIALEFIDEISSRFPAIKLILSLHDFSDMPEDLEGLYRKMQKIPASFYKLAVTANSCIDALRLMCWAKGKDEKLIVISMGDHGQASRILGPVIGSPITYAALEEGQECAPGQLSAEKLINRYRHKALTKDIAIYGLVGDPVTQSISDETHNRWFTNHGIDAVYIKFQVRSEELSEFIRYAKRLGVRGLSVTMPLKEQVIPFLDEIDPMAQDMGAVNTLVFDEGKILGYNTDGIGALNAIEKRCLVQNRRVIIMGAGGAAKAIAYEALRRRANVTLLNRDAEKAMQIARRLHCQGGSLEDLALWAQKGYDILINSTPVSLPVDPEHLLPQAIVMDITTKPKITPFLRMAKERGCQTIYGFEMFSEQAYGQFSLWFANSYIGLLV